MQPATLIVRMSRFRINDYDAANVDRDHRNPAEGR
jgi:hypothetical protein